MRKLFAYLIFLTTIFAGLTSSEEHETEIVIYNKQIICNTRVLEHISNVTSGYYAEFTSGIHIVYEDETYRTRMSYYIQSTDYGLTWSDPMFVGYSSPILYHSKDKIYVVSETVDGHRIIYNSLGYVVTTLPISCAKGTKIPVVNTENDISIMSTEPIVQDTYPPVRFQQKKWVYFCYLDGDNNLESAGHSDFKEIKKEGSTNEVVWIVLKDDYKGGNTKMWVCNVGGGATEIPLNQIDPNWVDEVNMGDPDTLIKSAKWVIDNYPSDHLAIDMWNHGNIYSVCYDDNSGKDALKLNELRSAFRTIMEHRKKPIDVVLYDACIMATAELYYETKEFCDNIVASQTYVPGDGFPYNKGSSANMCGRLNQNPQWTGSEFAACAVEEYYKYYGTTNHLSAVNITTFDYEFMTDLNWLCQMMKHEGGKYQSQIESALTNSKTNTGKDIIRFLSNLKSASVSQEIKDATDEALNSIKKAVAKNGGPANMKGLSIYDKTSKPVMMYNEMMWDEFKKALGTDYPNDEPTCTITEPSNGSSITPGKPVDIKGTASDPDGLSKVQVKVGRGDWKDATGTTSWSYQWIPPQYLTGYHKIFARSLDSKSQDIEKDFSKYVDITVNAGGAGSPLSIRLNKPNGGEKLSPNAQFEINWTSTGNASPPLKVKIEYSTNGSSGSYTRIVNNIPDTGSYIWTVPPTPSDDCYVKITITDSSSPQKSASDISDKNFTILTQPLELTVLEPCSGDVWSGGSVHDIKWSASGGIGNRTIKLEYSTTGQGGSYTPIADNEKDDCVYTWTTPSIDSNQCVIKITVKDECTPPQQLSNYSSGVFTIDSTEPTIDIKVPNSTTIWNGGIHKLEVNLDDNFGLKPNSVNISYTIDGSNWIPIGTNLPIASTYDWNIQDVNSKTCKIRISVIDFAGHETVKESNLFTVDTRNPDIQHQPVTSGIPGVDIQINAEVKDNFYVNNVTLNYTTVSGIKEHIQMERKGTTYTATIPGQPTIGKVKYHIVAFDKAGNFDKTKIYMIDIKQSETTGTIEGKVTSGVTGKPLPKVKVTAKGPVVSTTTTDTNGEYRLESLKLGKYEVIAEKDGFATVRTTTEVVEGSATRVDFRLFSIGTKVGCISGIVTDKSTGDALKEVKITVYQNGKKLKTVYSKSDGTYTIPALSEGIYTLKASKTGYEEVIHENVKVVEKQTTELNIEMIRKGEGKPSLPISLPMIATIIGIVIFCVVFAIGVIVLRKRRELPPQYYYPPTAPYPYHQPLQTPYLQQYSQTPTEQTKICRRCGRQNEIWRLSCVYCKSNLGG